MDFKDTFFSDKQALNCRGRLIDFKSPRIMGILNITPDSFYSGSRLTDPEQIRDKAAEMIDLGADILDVGAFSSRPGSEKLDETEEMTRLDKALSIIRKFFPEILLSVDTFRSSVAARVVKDFGADMINDISGGDLDQEMFPTMAELGVPYIIMHMKGTPATMQEQAVYKDVLKEVLRSFSDKITRLNRIGVNDIIIDPGFGFAKTIEHNFDILNQLEAFHIFRQPLMIGISRKSMVHKSLNISPAEALNGSTVLNTIALIKGANILRVHDVKEAREAIHLVKRTMEAEKR